MFIAPLALIAALNGATAYTNQPVQIASCSVAAAPVQASFPGLDLPYDGALSISFMNTSPRTVKSVTFGVNDGRSTSTVIDAGTFSTNVRIDHAFTAPQLMGDGDVACSVQSVAFTDGSTWQAQ